MAIQKNIYKQVLMKINAGSAYNNLYINYRVRMGFSNPETTIINDWKLIYNGKALVLDGVTEIRLDKVLRDYAFRPDFQYNEKDQCFEPVNSSTLSTLSKSVEYGDGSIYNALVEVRFYNGDDEILSPVYMNVNITSDGILTPYDRNGQYADEPQDWTFHQYDDGFVSHIPYCETSHYWIGVQYAANRYADVNVVSTGNDSGVASSHTGYGNYCLSYTLNDVIRQLEQGGSQATVVVIYGSEIDDRIVGGDAFNSPSEIRGGMGARVPTSGGSGSVFQDGDKIYLKYDNERHQVAVVDKCPSKWYMTWWSDGLWHSSAMGTVIRKSDREPVEITDIYDRVRNIDTRIQASFTASTGRITNDTIKYWERVLASPYVVLYDVENDKDYWCTLPSQTVNVVKTNTYKAYSFELTEIIREER